MLPVWLTNDWIRSECRSIGGKMSPLSLSRSLTHALFFCCVRVALSLSVMSSPSAKSIYSLYFPHLLLYHQSTSSFHDSRPFHVSTACDRISYYSRGNSVQTCFWCEFGLRDFLFLILVLNTKHLTRKFKKPETLAADAKASWIHEYYMRVFLFCFLSF